MSRRTLLLLCLPIALCLGCSRSKLPSNPKTIAVKGRVLLASGQPLNGGHLVFHNKDPKKAAIQGRADLESNGTFVPSTFGQDDGLMPGSYTVVVEPVTYKGKSPKPVNENLIPKKFQKKESSTLEVEVKDGEEKLPDLVLK